MLKPETALEQLFFVTARLQCQKAAEGWSGTGFWVYVPLSDGTNQALLVTNRHVVSPPKLGDAELIQIITPGASLADQSVPEFGTKSISVAQPPKFVTHPNDAVDIAVMAPNGLPLIGQRQPFLKTIPIDMLNNDAILAELDAIEQVTFIGYPSALHDTVNMTPLARRGWTATPISLDYNGQPKILIDASVFPGSSGSPVLVVNSGSYVRRDGGVTMGTSRIILLGIVAEMYSRTTAGKLIPVAGLPQVAVQQALNIGVVYKTRSILEAIDHFLSQNGLSREVTASVTTAATPVDPPDPSQD